MTYPIKIRLSRGALDELQLCEEASYEDAGNNPGDLSYYRPDGTMKPHTYEITQRYKTVLEIRDQEEAIAVFMDVCLGTFQLVTEYRNRLASARKIADILRPHVPEDIRRYSPDGY